MILIKHGYLDTYKAYIFKYTVSAIMFQASVRLGRVLKKYIIYIRLCGDTI